MILSILVTSVIILNVIDLVQTKIAFDYYGTDGELNPIVNFLYSRFGFTSVIIYKIVMIGFALICCIQLESILLALFLTGLYIFVVVHNQRAARFNKD